ncbi:hypothetical protein [Gloeocapsopsis dulcis]|uniref:hypothetical protein n=1 Tax=Gloeocapsopsis dulcis TaxID=2859516 RepID=UPI00101AD5D4
MLFALEISLILFHPLGCLILELAEATTKLVNPKLSFITLPLLEGITAGKSSGFKKKYFFLKKNICVYIP